MTIYHWQDNSLQLSITLTQEQIDSVCQSGSNDAAVAAQEKPDFDSEILKKVLLEYGGWDYDELNDHQANLERIFWVACWDCFECPEVYKAQ